MAKANKCRIKTEGKKIKVNIIEYFNNDYLIERMRERERVREGERENRRKRSLLQGFPLLRQSHCSITLTD